MEKETKRDYEYELFNGEYFITFNVVEVSIEKKEVIIAITSQGKMSVCTFDLRSSDGRFFFEYGSMMERVFIDKFENAGGISYEI